MRLEKIISGGQTGADRGGLDAAIALDIDHGGWCPRGRRAEDGRVPRDYELRELTTLEYEPRTRANVEESDATAVFVDDYLTTGSRKTVAICADTGKPYVIVRVKRDKFWDNVHLFQRFLRKSGVVVLNVAGTRKSRASDMQQIVCDIMCKAIEGIWDEDEDDVE